METYHWLQPGEMLDGLGMAETTPGPLIQGVQFVGFMGAYRYSDALDPMMAGILASFLVTWVTFYLLVCHSVPARRLSNYRLTVKPGNQIYLLLEIQIYYKCVYP